MKTDPDLIWYAIQPFLREKRVMAYGEKSAPADWLPPRHAVVRAYLHTGTQFKTSFLVVDVDDVEDAGMAWKRAGLPPPHFVVNRWEHNRSAHLIWALNMPVSRSAQSKAAKYLDDIRRAYTKACDGDPRYSNQRMKSPLSPDWYTWMPGGAPVQGYTLRELHAKVDLRAAPRPKQKAVAMTERPEGRNCTLFGAAMKEAARQCYRLGSGLHVHVLEFCNEQNAQFPEPLPPNEVETVAKSAASRAHRDHHIYRERFLIKQENGRRKSIRVRVGAANAKAEIVLKLRAAGLTWAQVAAESGFPAETCRRLARRGVVICKEQDRPACTGQGEGLGGSVARPEARTSSSEPMTDSTRASTSRRNYSSQKNIVESSMIQAPEHEEQDREIPRHRDHLEQGWSSIRQNEEPDASVRYAVTSRDPEHWIIKSG